METDTEESHDSLQASEREGHVKKKFSKAQVACLNSFFEQGMIGTSKENRSLIAQAAEDTCLTTDQVKVRVCSTNSTKFSPYNMK